MPHKHKRQRTGDPQSESFDLPPTTIAKPLPTSSNQQQKKSSKGDDDAVVAATDVAAGAAKDKTNRAKGKAAKLKKQRKRREQEDDTPRAFARLMQYQATGKRPPSGLDDGNSEGKRSSKKRKRALDDGEGKRGHATTTDTNKKVSTGLSAATKSPAAVPAPPASDSQSTTTTTTPLPPTTAAAIPKILPGERLSDFAARVDQALPISGLRGTNKQSGAKLPAGLPKERTLTRHNKRLERMQKDWREEEARRKAKAEEELEEHEEEREEQAALWGSTATAAQLSSKGKKKKGKAKASTSNSSNTIIGLVGDVDEDPWAILAKSRKDAKQKNLQDVVQAPPQLRPLNKKSMMVALKHHHGGGDVAVDVGNVPASVGSLRKREEMGRARREVIEGYRSMMKSGAAVRA